jgi:uncharacterized membrane protein YgcG
MARVPRLLAVVSTSALLLTGCSLFEREPNEPEVVESEEPAVVDEVAALLEPLLGDEESLPTSQEVFETLMDAGYSEDQLEATQDATPLDTGVSSKMFAVLVDEGCVVGEIREGEVMARLMPPSESTGTCLYGNVERPEGAPEPSGEPRDEDGDDNGAGHIPGEDFSRQDEGSEDGDTGDSGDSGDSGSGDSGTEDGGGDTGGGDSGSGDSGGGSGDAGLGGN